MSRYFFVAIIACLLSLSDYVEARPRFWVSRILDSTSVFSTWYTPLTFPRINNANQVVLEAYFIGPRMAIWSDGKLRRPQLPPHADTTKQWSDMIPFGLNNYGTAVGQFNSPYHVHGFLSDGNWVSELPAFDSAHWVMWNGIPVCERGIAYDVNDQNHASGWSAWVKVNDTGFQEYRNRPVVWINGMPISWGTLAGYHPDSVRYDYYISRINNSDQIAGSAQIRQSPEIGTTRAYFGGKNSLQKLSFFTNGNLSVAFDISDSGHVVGYEQMQSGTTVWKHAWIYRDGSKKSLHGDPGQTTIRSEAYGVNSQGQVVGAYVAPGGSAQIKALYYDGDSTFDLNALVVNFPGGSPALSNNLIAATGINDAGTIVAIYQSGGLLYPCLLTPYDTGLIVNSTGDAPDIDPNDGKCYTGAFNSIGQEECTFRAAIQCANLTPVLDTIAFNIPPTSPGVPIIRPNSSGQGGLPVIGHPAYIDATTQPGTHRVALDCDLQGISFHGLEIDGEGSTVRGFAIYNSKFDGIYISTINVAVKGCYIGLDASGIQPIGNKKSGIEVNLGVGCRIGDSSPGEGNRIEGNEEHGIYLKGGNSDIQGNWISYNGYSTDSGAIPRAGILIEGSQNRIGGLGAGAGNTLIGNRGSGIKIDFGERNSILSNTIDSNYQYGIDLLPPVGPTLNDSLDGDFGANDGQNFPVIDSVIYSPLPARLYGHLVSSPNISYNVQLFSSRSCDLLGYGEGHSLRGTMSVTTNASGVALFGPVNLPGVLESEFLTATATDPDGNTSEFSKCYSLPRLVILDHDKNPIPLTKFHVARVVPNYPLLTETFHDSVDTDSMGQIFLKDVDLQRGDNVRVYRHLHTEPRSKAPVFFGSKYSVRMDNMQFNADGYPSYYLVNDSVFQHVITDHTVIGYNLVVSIEWDAELSYLQSTETNLRRMANFYYDVSDGQIMFDTIAIVDDHAHWYNADMWIHASSDVWPHCLGGGGIHASGTWLPSPVYMPRKFFGSSDDNRNMSVTHHPLDMDDRWDYETRAHELGHYMLDVRDEYTFGYFGLGGRCKVQPPVDYGLMDGAPCFDAMCSELSSALTYQNSSCQNTKQYILNGMSCWDQWEAEVEKDYSGLYAHILKPNERDSLPPGIMYLAGPNDSRTQPDYDVGRLTTFPVTPTTPAAAVSRLYKTIFTYNGSPMKEVWVSIVRPGEYAIAQGSTSDSGLIWVLGYKPGDEVWFSHFADEWVNGRFVNSARAAAVGSGDTIIVALDTAAGHPRMLQRLDLTSNQLSINQSFNVGLPGQPTISLYQASSAVGPFQMSGADTHFVAVFPDSGPFSGLLIEMAPDIVGDTFFFLSELEYSGTLPDDSWMDMRSKDGRAQITRDSLATDIDRVALLATIFPVIRTGLDSAMEQAGPVVSLATLPAFTSSDKMAVVIRYSDSELTGEGSFGHEQSLRLFKWDELDAKWVLLGGDVDTLHNEVYGPVESGGIYAAFTIDFATDVDDETPNLPQSFKLAQNYPNPFNATTTIHFSLPKRCQVYIEVLNLLGQSVAVLANGQYLPGPHIVKWNGRDKHGEEVASGIYFYHLTAGDYSAAKKMLLIK